MKPSERIIEIYDKWHPNNPLGDTEVAITSDMLSSIITYLDEQHALQTKDKPNE